MATSNFIKVHFQLAQDEDGYPPVTVESVWARPGTNSREFVIENVPFFAREATLGDTVLIRDENGSHWFEAVLHSSGNSLIRIVFFNRLRLDRVRVDLLALGCELEYFEEYNILAVSIPKSVRLTDVQQYLQAEAGRGDIDYEEPILRQ